MAPDVRVAASNRNAARALRARLRAFDARVVREDDTWYVVARGHPGDVQLLLRLAEAAREVVAETPDVELHLLDAGRRVRLPPPH